MDCWTDKSRKATFFGFTIHYISTEKGGIVLNDRILVIRELLAESKDGDFLQEKLIEYLVEFGLMDLIENKIVFVSDRGTNIVKALKSYQHINCFGHLMHNCVEKMLEKNETVQIVTSIVKYFKVNGINALFEKL